VIGVGDAVRQALIDNEGIPGERIGIIYNGVDLDRFARQEALRGEVRRELGIGAKDFAVLQVARMDYLKDHATAIRTLARVLEWRTDVYLVLVGEGPELSKIQTLVQNHKLDDRVRFLGLRNDIPRLLSGADAFLL